MVACLEGQRGDETLPQLEARIGRLEKALQGRRAKRSNLREKIAGLKVAGRGGRGRRSRRGHRTTGS